MADILIRKVDITTLAVDAIVNAANNTLLGGGGVDGAIHRAAGVNLLLECKTLAYCATGDAKITQGYRLPAKFVIHTVGPIWQGGDHHESDLLAACYKNSLLLAAKNNIKTIAFPSISCGVYRFPIPLACKIAINTVIQTVNEHDFEKIIFACFNDETQSALESALHTKHKILFSGEPTDG